MNISRPKKKEIVLSQIETTELESIAASRSLSHGLVRRAQMILASACGETNSAIAKRHHVTVPTVNHWRGRFLEQGLVVCTVKAGPVVHVLMVIKS